MAKYYQHNLEAESGHGVSPAIEGLNGLQVMRRGPVEAVFRAQDRVVSMGRRIVASGGMRGSETFFVGDTDPTLVANSHPAPGERRLIGAGSADITPGNFLRCWIVVVPSGETQTAGQAAGGANGSILVACVWTDQDAGTESTSNDQPLEGSVATFGAQPGNMHDALYQYDLNIRPPGLNDPAEVRRWSRNANVQVLIYAVGGARPVDVCVFEQRFSIALEADDDGEQWCSHIFGPGSPDGASVSPLLYPYQRQLEATPDGDPRSGTLHLMDVHHAQHKHLGPVLFSWSGAQESTGEEGVTVTSNTLVELAGGGSTSFTLTEPGLAVGTGGYARRHSSNSPFVLRDRVAAIPVFVRVYAEMTDATGSVRVQTRDDSYVDLTVPVSAVAWHIIYGWLEVGINPDDTLAVLGQLFGSADTVTDPNAELTVHAVTVHYAGGYTPAA